MQRQRIGYEVGAEDSGVQVEMPRTSLHTTTNVHV